MAEKLTGNLPIAALLVAWNETEADAIPDAGPAMTMEERLELEQMTQSRTLPAGDVCY